MATKKSKNKVTKKVGTAPGKRSSPVRAKKTTRPKKTTARRARPAAASKSKKALARVAPHGGRATRRSAPKAPPKSRKPASRKKEAASKPGRPTSERNPVRRYDRPGHLDPKYAAGLRHQSGPKTHDPRGFLDAPRSPKDDFAEVRGEDVVEKATTGEDAAEESLDQVVPEERGGPFVETTGAKEFAQGTDSSNPKGAFREPFPTT